MSTQQQALTILDEHRIGVMASIVDGRPSSRYMTFIHDGFTLYTLTANDANRLAALQQNPATHILYGYEGEGVLDTFLEIEGTVAIATSETLKEQVMRNLRVELDSEHMVLLEIQPTRMRLMNKAGDNQQEIVLQGDE